jgi:hypothetical protein
MPVGSLINNIREDISSGSSGIPTKFGTARF